jgi:hypothetical protein
VADEQLHMVTYQAPLPDELSQLVVVREQQHWHLAGIDAHFLTCKSETYIIS